MGLVGIQVRSGQKVQKHIAPGTPSSVLAELFPSGG